MQEASFFNIPWNNRKHKAWYLFHYEVLHSPTWNFHHIWNAQETWEGTITIKCWYNGEHAAVHPHCCRKDLHIKFPLLWVMGHLLISEVTNPVVKRMSSENKFHYITDWYDGFFICSLCYRSENPFYPTLGVSAML